MENEIYQLEKEIRNIIERMAILHLTNTIAYVIVQTNKDPNNIKFDYMWTSQEAINTYNNCIQLLADLHERKWKCQTELQSQQLHRL